MSLNNKLNLVRPKKEKQTKAQKILGVVKRREDNFKKSELIPFLKSIKNGFVDERIYIPGFYSTKKYMPDVMFLHHGQVYYFETKSKTGILSDGQKVRHKELENAGAFVFVVNPNNLEVIKQTIKERCGE